MHAYVTEHWLENIFVNTKIAIRGTKINILPVVQSAFLKTNLNLLVYILCSVGNEFRI